MEKQHTSRSQCRNHNVCSADTAEKVLGRLGMAARMAANTHNPLTTVQGSGQWDSGARS